MPGVPKCFSCKKTAKTDPELSFFRFPRETNRCLIWLQQCGQDLFPLPLYTPDYCYKNLRLCSNHFERSMFSSMQLNRLHIDAVPTFDKDSDPLAVPNADDLSLFGDSMENIELIIEDSVDDCTLGTKSNPFVIQIANLQEATVQQYSTNEDILNVSVPSAVAEKDDVIDLDSPSPTLEEIKEEILEVEEPRIQLLQDQEMQIVQEPVSYERTVEVPQDSGAENIVCYVPECIANLQDKIYWFGVPVDENLKKVWDICIDRKDKRLSNQDVICHKHFLNDDVVLDVTALNKKEATATLSEFKLKQGAVPCIKFYEECCVPTCRQKSGRKYCFPVLRTSDFHLWLYMIKNPSLRNLKMKEVLRHRVCQLHFELDCFDDEFLLKRIAAPTLNLPEYGINYNTKPVSHSEIQCTAQQDVFTLCAYRGCRNNSHTGKNLFRFPTDPHRCTIWLRACGREDLITSKTATVQRIKAERLGVCEDHFDFHQFQATMDKLEPNAIPKNCDLPIINFKELKKISGEKRKKSPDLSEKISRSFSNSRQLAADSEKKPSESTPAFSGICFYRGCHSKASEDNQFFNFPADPERCHAWLEACGRTNLPAKARDKISKSQRICSKHFEIEMFESENKLKDDAVPLIHEILFLQKQGFCASNSSSKSLESEDSFTSKDNADNTIRKKGEDTQAKCNRIYCAVENCLNYYKAPAGKEIYHRFPNPTTDSQKFSIWLQLIANRKLCEYSNEEIYKKFIVCPKHFDTRFYKNGIKSSSLCEEAVPTINLTADIKWFFDTDYYKTQVQNYFNNIPEKDFPRETIEWRKDDTINLDSSDDGTKCILEEDRIRFPGMGRYLYLGKRKNLDKKGKSPYGVYKHFKSGYGLNSFIEFGESIRIHTAIIIDDDDDCEREVLQQLLDKRKTF